MELSGSRQTSLQQFYWKEVKLGNQPEKKANGEENNIKKSCEGEKSRKQTKKLVRQTRKRNKRERWREENKYYKKKQGHV